MPGPQPTSSDAPPLLLSEHDPSWAERFQVEAAVIRDTLGGEVVAIEHIGSTAVPGLLAKPVLDLLVGLRRVPPSAGAIERMEARGFRHRGEHGLPERAYFTRPGVHVHGYEPGRGQWGSHLLFRDYLRAVEAAREAYASAKRALLRQGNGDRGYYVTHKEAVVTRLLEDARRWERDNVTRASPLSLRDPPDAATAEGCPLSPSALPGPRTRSPSRR